MNTKQLKYVLELYREASFTAAAENLGITQSSLSQYIKKIESELGVSLFIRNGNTLEPTPAGIEYIEASKKILSIEHKLLLNIDEIKCYTRGMITIGVSPYICSSVMPSILSKFNKRYPNIKIILSEKVTSALIEGAMCGEFDICVAPLPDDASLFNYRIIPNNEIVLAVPKSLGKMESSVESGRLFPVIDFSQLNGIPFVVHKKGQVIDNQLEKLCNTCGIEIRRVVECVNIEAIHAMVYNGLGCALIPYRLLTKDTQVMYSQKIDYYSLRQILPWETAVYWLRTLTPSKPMWDLINLILK